MKPPGLLDELGEEGAAAWSERVAGLLDRATRQLEGTTHLTARLDDADALTTLDWTGFPTRIATCLTREDALELLDAPTGVDGRRALQTRSHGTPQSPTDPGAVLGYPRQSGRAII